MMGAIAGDVIGSAYEGSGLKLKGFPLFSRHTTFTDDTVLTVAVADALVSGRTYLASVRQFGRRHPRAGYGESFASWLQASDDRPYGSWGNGSAMRVGPIGFAFDDEADVLREAAASATITHDHPEGIKGAQAVALAILLVRQGNDNEAVRARITSEFGYDLARTLREIRPGYTFDVSCQGSVPESILAFLEATDWEDAVRNAVSLGGDADTQACIAGAIAEARWGVPAHIEERVRGLLTPDLREVLDAFRERWPSGECRRTASSVPRGP